MPTPVAVPAVVLVGFRAALQATVSMMTLTVTPMDTQVEFQMVLPLVYLEASLLQIMICLRVLCEPSQQSLSLYTLLPILRPPVFPSPMTSTLTRRFTKLLTLPQASLVLLSSLFKRHTLASSLSLLSRLMSGAAILTHQVHSHLTIHLSLSIPLALPTLFRRLQDFLMTLLHIHKILGPTIHLFLTLDIFPHRRAIRYLSATDQFLVLLLLPPLVAPLDTGMRAMSLAFLALLSHRRQNTLRRLLQMPPKTGSNLFK